jgi:3-oxoacyl-[acyl-carrier-protein] synthase II
MNRVVVTGYGAICALGNNAQAIWQGILDKQLGYAKLDDPPKNVNARFFGKINQPLDTGRFSKRILKNTPRFAQLALIAAQEAVEMAFGEGGSPQGYYADIECGAIVGTGWGGFDNTAANYFAWHEGTPSIQSCFHTMPSIATAAIAINWNLKGYQSTPVAACATGSIAVGEAYEMIKSGRMKMMLAGGAESTLTPFPMWSIDVLGALSKEQEDAHKACCPFSKERSGFILAEGGAVICLESREHALQRNALILGEIVGYANHSDAYVNLTAPAPDLTGRITTITQALKQAGLSPDRIDYINAHGTSTPMNDANETEVLKQVFGEAIWQIPVSSTKSYTGHLIAAAGAIETLFCLKSIQDRIVPATINYHTPDPQCDLNYVPNHHLYNQRLEHVINVNYGFGGANSCLVIKGHSDDD